MNLQRTVPWKLAAGVVVGVVIALVLIAWKWDPGAKPLEVHYPYWCKDCKAVFDVSELKKDYPRNWRIAPGGPSDSVVICVQCDKGWAYPVATCPRCGKKYVLHLIPGTRCPYCHPEVAEAAKKLAVSLTPPEIDR